MNKHIVVGPGGIDCPCCFPRRGSKARKIRLRAAKKKEKKFALELELSQGGET